MKFPNEQMTDEAIQLTCPLEIKYTLFNKEDGVIKTEQLRSSQVLINYLWSIIHGYIT